ncbi:MAG: NRDE family protein [Xanthomonadales bacterium]|nr:NRDE family protein [Xanthomonadales bacterium]
MCVVAFAWQAHPRWRLLLIGNRDEFHGRPSAALSAWPQCSILAGRDLVAGGTWAGVDRHGRCAVVTNVRNGDGANSTATHSRGQLPLAFLSSAPDAHGRQTVVDTVTTKAGLYAPFNLLLVDQEQCRVLSNHPRPEAVTVAPGIHGLTNGGFPSQWPKAQALCTALATWLAADTTRCADTADTLDAIDLAALWAALHNRQAFPDHSLPDTGVGMTLERRLSPVFIKGPEYGTRACTVIAVDHSGKGWIMERGFGPDGMALGERSLPIG